MPVTAVTCPSCRAVLTLKAAPPPGMTRAKCPKCGAAVPLDAPSDPGETRANLADAPSDPTADATPFDPPAATAAYPFLAPPQQPDEIGRLGPYRVLAAIGAGGMGAVFRAEDPALRRRLALKVMLPEFAVSPTAKARFLREARAQAAVEHDHVAAALPNECRFAS